MQQIFKPLYYSKRIVGYPFYSIIMILALVIVIMMEVALEELL